MLKTKARARKGDSRKAARRASRTRRTTLTLPEELLNKVERFAETRHQTVSAAITYLVESALWNEPASPRNSRGILEMWRKSFLPLTEQERLLVDGIILDERITEAE
ncbi:MAG TPA: hypothetical protein VNY30_04465 [Bryobacteraceae bacterium]|jgi:uncharacterized protein (DUF927 family)|nr:hypothetical protein [Bryobacteraceae bacterium]